MELPAWSFQNFYPLINFTHVELDNFWQGVLELTKEGFTYRCWNGTFMDEIWKISSANEFKRAEFRVYDFEEYFVTMTKIRLICF